MPRELVSDELKKATESAKKAKSSQKGTLKSGRAEGMGSQKA